MCVHGRQHGGVPIRHYRGLVTLGTKSGSGRVYEVGARLAVGGLHVDVLSGRGMLRHFKVTLGWRNGTGHLGGVTVCLGAAFLSALPRFPGRVPG